MTEITQEIVSKKVFMASSRFILDTAHLYPRTGYKNRFLYFVLTDMLPLSGMSRDSTCELDCGRSADNFSNAKQLPGFAILSRRRDQVASPQQKAVFPEKSMG